MKKILFITAFPPNKLTAGQNYSKEVLNSLVNEYEIDLIYCNYPNHDLEIDSKINLLKIVNVSKWSKIYSWLHLPFLHPFFVARFRFRLLLYLLRNSKKYDILYFDFSQIFIYSLFLRKKIKLFMSHDVIYQKIKRNKFFYLNPFNIFLFATEKLILKSASLILTFSEKDKELIKNIYHLNSEVVSFFISEKIKEINYNEIHLSRKFCFFGAWNRPENMNGLIWFLNNVLPYVNDDIKFEIIGPSINESLLSKIKVNDKIKYLGFLENPYNKIAESQALIAPIFQGAGVKVKVLESLATGTSIIGTELAFEGIDDIGMKSMLLCNNAADFINFINNFELRNSSEKNEIKFIFEKTYHSKKIIEILKN
jgi:hypothetical protein